MSDHPDTLGADKLVEELLRTRRDRRVLVITAVLGIMVGTTLGLTLFLGALEGVSSAPHTHLALACFVVVPLGCLALGHALASLRGQLRHRLHPT